MSKKEVRRVLSYMQNIHLIMAKLLYDCGLQLMECIRLRVHNLDFERHLIYIYDAKGNKDRIVNLPRTIHKDMQFQVEKVKCLHNKDLSKGFGEVFLPEALARKYPRAARKYRWQHLFPAKKLSIDPRSGITRRHHVIESGSMFHIDEISQNTTLSIINYPKYHVSYS